MSAPLYNDAAVALVRGGPHGAAPVPPGRGHGAPRLETARFSWNPTAAQRASRREGSPRGIERGGSVCGVRGPLNQFSGGRRR